MFRSVKEGETSGFGINYLVSYSKFHKRFIFDIVFPWFGDRERGVVRISFPRPFSEAKEGWNYRIVGLSFYNTIPPVYESDSETNNN